MSGYLYRICPANAEQLYALVAELVGPSCWTFGGAALWDLEPARGRENLRPLTQVDAAAAISLAGDFGHAFTPAAEVRWRRRDETTYDVLVLSEAPLTVAGSTLLANGWMTSDRASVILSDGKQLGVVAYHAPNGAVQFLRYKGVR